MGVIDSDETLLCATYTLTWQYHAKLEVRIYGSFRWDALLHHSFRTVVVHVRSYVSRGSASVPSSPSQVHSPVQPLIPFDTRCRRCTREQFKYTNSDTYDRTSTERAACRHQYSISSHMTTSTSIKVRRTSTPGLYLATTSQRYC